jgi:tetratricopeptide (TPR) repeat protein
MRSPFTINAPATVTQRRALADARFLLREAIAESYKVTQTPEVRALRGRLALLWAAACIFEPSPSQIELLETVRNEAIVDGQHTSAFLASYWINWIHHAVGNQRASEAGTASLLELVQDAGDLSTIALVKCHLGGVLLSENRLDEARAMLLEGLDRSPDTSASGQHDAPRVSGLYCYSLAQLAVVQAKQGSFEEARATIGEAMDLVRQTGERSTEASMNICAALVGMFAEDWAEARDRVEAIASLPDVSVSRYVRVVGASLSGYARFRLGEREEGLRLLRSGVAAQERSEQSLSLCLHRSLLADAMFRAGLVTEAASMARSALAARDLDDCMGEELATSVLLHAEQILADTTDRDPVMTESS